MEIIRVVVDDEKKFVELNSTDVHEFIKVGMYK